MSHSPKLPPRSSRPLEKHPSTSSPSASDQVAELQNKIKSILDSNPNVAQLISKIGPAGAMEAVQRIKLDHLQAEAQQASSSVSSHAPPLQPASFFRSNTESEGFTFTHSEKDVMLKDLSADAQARVIQNHAAHHHHTVQVGGSDGGTHAHSSPPAAEGKPDPKLLGPKAYYEQVQPSMWRPEESPDTVEALGDNFLGLYRRAYCIFADAAWPPLFFLVSFLLSSLLWFPMIVVLLDLLVIFLLGVLCCVEQLAGVKRKDIPLSRFVPAFIISLELSSLIGYLTVVMPEWKGANTSHGWTLLLTLIVLVPMHLYITLFTDPGYIKPSDTTPGSKGSSEVKAGEEERHLLMEAVPGPVVKRCQAEGCGVETRLRSKHCKVCKKCVRRLDHHCPAMYTCIGEGNQRIFMIYIMTISLSQLLFIFSCMDYFAQEAGLGEGGGFFSSLLSASTKHRPLCLLTVLHMFLVLASISLNLRCWFNILSNLTTAEQIKRLEIDYLNSEIGYCNRFDRGALSNAWQFWTNPSPNWEQEYQSGQSYLERNGLTMTNHFSPGWIFSYYDWRKRQKAILAKRKEEEMFQRIAKGEI